ncbi:MAG TPA: NAD(P)-binding protein [Solirubrobacteraceae bacterium]|nr:NAD(P)-binding protein [Solirubrobacteraceae bacterium]
MVVETDYLVVGAGATGLAFVDALVAESDVEVTIVDRQAATGGHWLRAYPFVRLHTPSAYYGVNSLPLGEDRIDQAGENAGYYERATGGEVRDYFAQAAARLVQTGRVRLLTGHEHLGGGGQGEQVRDLGTGRLHDVLVRRKVVDARYLESSIPATHTPEFEVAADARVVPVNDLPAAAHPGASYAVLGSGKTSADACSWLLGKGVEPERIRWIRPRDAWFYDRRHWQPLDQVATIMDGLSLDAEAGARAADVEDLFARLEASGRLVRIDPSAPATMYRGTMLSAGELDGLRQIDDVVRLGRVARIAADRITLERGEVPTGPGVLHVDCTARGLNNAPGTAIFQPGRIVLQQVRYLSPCFNAALIAFVEAHRDDDTDKNRLCPSTPYPSRIDDLPRLMCTTWTAEANWLSEPDLATWMSASRLNLMRALPDHAAEPSAQTAVKRYLTHVGTAIERMSNWGQPASHERRPGT